VDPGEDIPGFDGLPALEVTHRDGECGAACFGRRCEVQRERQCEERLGARPHCDVEELDLPCVCFGVALELTVDLGESKVEVGVRIGGYLEVQLAGAVPLTAGVREIGEALDGAAIAGLHAKCAVEGALGGGGAFSAMCEAGQLDQAPCACDRSRLCAIQPNADVVHDRCGRARLAVCVEPLRATDLS
jgi:hypothetical protein